jgi:hypothetical protein
MEPIITIIKGLGGLEFTVNRNKPILEQILNEDEIKNKPDLLYNFHFVTNSGHNICIQDLDWYPDTKFTLIITKLTPEQVITNYNLYEQYLQDKNLYLPVLLYSYDNKHLKYYDDLIYLQNENIIKKRLCRNKNSYIRYSFKNPNDRLSRFAVYIQILQDISQNPNSIHNLDTYKVAIHECEGVNLKTQTNLEIQNEHYAHRDQLIKTLVSINYVYIYIDDYYWIEKSQISSLYQISKSGYAKPNDKYEEYMNKCKLYINLKNNNESLENLNDYFDSFELS